MATFTVYRLEFFLFCSFVVAVAVVFAVAFAFAVSVSVFVIVVIVVPFDSNQLLCYS